MIDMGRMKTMKRSPAQANNIHYHKHAKQSYYKLENKVDHKFKVAKKPDNGIKTPAKFQCDKAISYKLKYMTRNLAK